jgi:hypothetical protein
MVAADNYAEPIANMVCIISTPLSRAILFSGELGGGPRCCFHASGGIKAKASEKNAEHHDSHSILSKPLVKQPMTPSVEQTALDEVRRESDRYLPFRLSPTLEALPRRLAMQRLISCK